MKNYGGKSKNLLDQQVTVQTIMMKNQIKFNSGDNLPLKKTLEFHAITIVVRSVFHEGNKYPQVFLFEMFVQIS